MNRLLAMLVIGLGLGAGIGFLLAAANGVTLDGHDHEAHDTDISHSHVEMLEVPAINAPKLSVELTEDPVSGHNLHVVVENFHFAPERSGDQPVANEGHAHVYVNGNKIARLYGSWMHIASLPPDGEVEVTLNSNDHRVLAIDGKAISSRVSLGSTE
ncbi:hypothetical protein PXK30_19235 [Phaeobacter gallaeciensis]|uniref:hypothetical protein n=1 Tax=Phaeobacter gallaeciensis TaxID=60890 RepID=UPI00237F3A6C|nr:hypothetical protein [Phaeobacter gallaeciensis]MDE4305819.1 hypothetical protein [Phaeobacter gallaeciensis]MDE4310200.1 hypothetical protein [Phaeobacter gallaeciensis]MDE4314712.1 hypothetical protein [Phaeobacter gallaeciensis]MDE4319103.1 hypothetical protein [Phaeobacter gallaeciensis]MDE4323569.1 hypothetical protein [Phaeobacter gallaeciensis]